MADSVSLDRLTPEQRDLWQRVEQLWALSGSRDEARIRSALHPDYVGWDMASERTHDREAAIRSVSGQSQQVVRYSLNPLSIRIYDGKVGVVHYAYAADIVPSGATPATVTGRWTEIYLRENREWIMIAVSGRPDTEVVDR